MKDSSISIQTKLGSSTVVATHSNTRIRSTVIIAILPFTVAAPGMARYDLSTPEAHCIEASAERFGIPMPLLTAIRLQEGGTVGRWHVNVDGSIDYGVMQINSRWLPQLRPSGYTASVLAYNACASISVGAWILAQSLDENGVWSTTHATPENYWRAVGRYHSRTPSLNRFYAERIWSRYQREVMP